MATALEMGISLGKAHRRKEAIEYLKQALLENPREVQAWLWISQLVDDRPTMKYCYRRVLEIEPDNFMAKQFLGFINETDANLKFFPDPPSPLQTYFENQQKSSRPMQMRKSFPEPAPNMRHSIVQSQNSRPVRPQTKLKKKRISPWISSFLVFTALITIVSIIVALVGFPLISFLSIQDPTFVSLSPNDKALSGTMLGLMLGLTTFTMLFSLLYGVYWIASGYVGAYFLIKKGYILEFIGCAIIAAGIPLLLPAVLGPLMYWWGNAVKEKRG